MKRVFTWLMSGSLFFMLLSQPDKAAAQSLNDFNNAVAAARSDNGCGSIPYDGMRDRCRTKSGGVNDFCKVEKINCDEFDPSGLRRNMEDMNGKISQLKRDRDDQQNRLSSASDGDKSSIQSRISDLNNQISDLQNKVESFQSRLNDEKSKIRDRIDNGQRCLQFRLDVQDIFKEAKTRAATETDPEIKIRARELMDYWASKEGGHQQVIDNTQRAINTCKSFQ